MCSKTCQRCHYLYYNVLERRFNWSMIYSPNLFNKIESLKLSIEKIFDSQNLCMIFNVYLSDDYAKIFHLRDIFKILNKNFCALIYRLNRCLSLNCTQYYMLKKTYKHLEFIIIDPSEKSTKMFLYNVTEISNYLLISRRIDMNIIYLVILIDCLFIDGKNRYIV